ncbi:MAG: efflux RND transporter periplasmic adaptor subunit [Flavobacteriaceae bacterium]
MKYTYLLGALALFFTSCSSDNSVATKAPRMAAKVQVIELAPVKTLDLTTFSGSVQAEDQAQLATRTMGSIEKIYAKAGEQVSKGALLIRISDSDLKAQKAQTEAQIAAAQAQYSNVKKDYDRIVILFDKGSATQKEMDDMTAHLSGSQAALEMANQQLNNIETQLKYTNIRAPFSGVVTKEYQSQGDLASPGRPILELVGTQGFKAVVNLPEFQAKKFSIGEAVKLSAQSQDYKATVARVIPSGSFNGGQYAMELKITNPQGLINGQYVKMSALKANTERLMIPVSAVKTYGQMDGVFLMTESGRAALVWVRLGKVDGDQVEVVSGLNSGDRMVLNPSNIKDGQKLSL